MGQRDTRRDFLELCSFFVGQAQRWSRWTGNRPILLLSRVYLRVTTLGEFDSPKDDPLQGLFRAAALVPFTPPFNVTGQPAMSLPLHFNDADLPIGVQLVAAYGREDLLISVAAQIESAAPWAQRVPPVRAT